MFCVQIVILLFAILSHVVGDSPVLPPQDTTTTSKPILKCGPYEIQNDCPVDCQSDYCPKNEEEAKLTECDTPKECPPPQCKCGFNSRYNASGSCISVYDCPPFPCNRPFEKYNPCPSWCPGESCDNATPDGRCPRIFGLLPVLHCNPACRCIKGYWRKDGVCVPYAECGKGTTTTSPSETEPPSTTDVPVTTPVSSTSNATASSGPCSDASAEAGSGVAKAETPGATAIPGPEFASAETRTTQCKPDKGKICGAHEVWECRSSCSLDTCASILQRIACTPQPNCINKCYCTSGYLRNKQNKCVTTCECDEMRNSLDCKKK